MRSCTYAYRYPSSLVLKSFREDKKRKEGKKGRAGPNPEENGAGERDWKNRNGQVSPERAGKPERASRGERQTRGERQGQSEKAERPRKRRTA